MLNAKRNLSRKRLINFVSDKDLRKLLTHSLSDGWKGDEIKIKKLKQNVFASK